MTDFAFSTDHPFVKKGDRWIVSLSDGTTIFEDKTPGQSSAWLRLSKYLIDRGLMITNLRLEYAGCSISSTPYRDENQESQLEGYWHMNKLGSTDRGSEYVWRGIGYVKNEHIHITWVRHDGVQSNEVRFFDGQDLGVILNEV
jgi:hypothetical protein